MGTRRRSKDPTRRDLLKVASAGVAGLATSSLLPACSSGLPADDGGGDPPDAGADDSGSPDAGHGQDAGDAGRADGGAGDAGNGQDGGRPDAGSDGGIPEDFSHRVVHIRRPGATHWDFVANYYYDAVNQSAVTEMVDRGMAVLTGLSTRAAAWRRVLSSYRPGDVVGVKINTNDINWGPEFLAALPEVINAVIGGLTAAGVPESAIRIYDSNRPQDGVIPQRYLTATHALYPAVTFFGPSTSSFNGNHPDQQISLPSLAWSTRLADQLCTVQHLIALPLLKAIRLDWGNSGALKLHHGSISSPGSTHNYLANADVARNPVAAINQNPHIRGKLRLVIADGLFGLWTGRHFNTPRDSGTPETDDIPSRWLTFGNAACDSLLFAADPVAIDSVQFDIIQRERLLRGLRPMAHPILDACESAGLGWQEHSNTLNYGRIDYRPVAI